MLPTALWPSWSMRLLGDTTRNMIMRPQSFRNALTVMLLLPGTLLTYRELSAMVEERTHQPAIKTIIGTFGEQQLSRVLSTLAQLAHALDENGAPIDYTRRRFFIAQDQPHVDHDAYERLCARHGWRRARPRRLALLDDYLIYLLTGARPTRNYQPQPSELDIAR
jgi:hypothetical protein